MRYCPECETVCVEVESSTCLACGEVLVRLDEVSPEERDRPVVLTWCQNFYEAQILVAALAAEGIQTVVEDDGLLARVVPKVVCGDATDTRVMVRLEDAERALEFLRSKDAGELAIGEDDLDDEELGETDTDD